ncbi:MAG: phosphonate ABC transporter ATP-binding protein [Planctomycetota bacterium]
MTQPRESEPLLRVSSLGVRYGNGVRAVRDVSLDVRRGECVAVIGPSGSGKSTLLRCVNRLIRPTEGEVVLDGVRITHASGRALRSVRRRVGMVFQQFNLVQQLPVIDNVLIGWIGGAPALGRCLAQFRRFPAGACERAEACLARVGLADRAASKASQLSGGQQQRVAIARVLMQDPEVILADEPIASLDPASSSRVLTLLREICDERGVPVLVNLHQVDEARRFATRVVGLNAGSVVFDGAPEALDAQQLERIYADTPAARTAGDIDMARTDRALQGVVA